MDTLKRILLDWKVWLQIFASSSLCVIYLVWRIRRKRVILYGRIRMLLVALLLLCSVACTGLGISLVFLPYPFMDFPGGFLCVFGVQVARAALEWADSLDQKDNYDSQYSIKT